MRSIVYKDKNIILDNGLLFGQSVFETILYENKPLFLREHIARLKDSMKKIELEELEEDDLLIFLDKINIKHKAVKIVVTPENIIIIEREVSYKQEDYNRGFSLMISDVLRNSTSILSYIKSTAYIENIIERKKAQKNGYDDVVFLNEYQCITETSCANIFFIKDSKIFTPKLADGLLDGIIRNWVFENYDVIEKHIRVNDLENADEVFVTNSLIGIMPIKRINNILYSCDKEINWIREKYKYKNF